MVMRWLLTNPWRALVPVLAAMVAVLLMQIHGVPLIGGGLRPALIACRAERAAIIAAQIEAGRLQAAVNEDEERRFAANAERSDTAHAHELDRAAAAAEHYAGLHRITAGRVRATSDRDASGQAPATAESDGAGFPAEMPADAFVAVSDSDLQACTAAVTYAVAAHKWAATLDGNTEFDEASR